VARCCFLLGFRWHGATNVALALLLCCTSAFAGNDASVSTAREIAKEGLSAYDAGRYAEADDKLSRALEVVGVPTLALYTARANVRLGKLVRASELYLLATRLDPKGPSESVQLQAQRDAAKERVELLPRIPRLTVNLEGEELDAVEVTIDEQTVPRALLGTAQFIDPGQRKLAAKRGDEQVFAEIELAEGEHKTTTLRFQPRKNGAGAPSAETKTLVSSPPNRRVTASVPVEPSMDRHKTQRTLGWVGVGLGSAGIVLGAFTGSLALGKRGQLHNSNDCSGDSCYTNKEGDVDSYNTMRTLSSVGFIAGGVLAAAGITLLLTAPKAESSIGMALLLAPGSASLVGKF
jgi:hypothetical protein